MLKIIIDFDGTLTAEEKQVDTLANKSLQTLSGEILHTPLGELESSYQATRQKLLSTPHLYGWKVKGLVASFCNEGAFILNTVTLQEMLNSNKEYKKAVYDVFPNPEYDPVADCTNYLFHRHTAEIPPLFRPDSCSVLNTLNSHPDITPIILTNSLSDKVERHLSTLALKSNIRVLGDTRQYDMVSSWDHRFYHPFYGEIQHWPAYENYTIDLRRPAYFQALSREASDGSQLAVVADTFSMPGSLPLMMGIHYFLLSTSYTPEWCKHVVESHPQGILLQDISHLLEELEKILK